MNEMNYDSRSQIITKLKIEATNNCPARYNFGSILLTFTFSSGFKALELDFPFFGVIKMTTKQPSAAQNRGGICKARENVVMVLAEF